MIELTPTAARAALERAYQEQRCPSCGAEVDLFSSFVLETGGVWFFCYRCVDAEVLADLVPARKQRQEQGR